MGIHRCLEHGKTLGPALLRQCCDDFFMPTLSAPRNLPQPRCCWSISCSAFGWSACRRCTPRSRMPTRLCACTWAANNGRAGRSRGLPNRSVQKPPLACLRPDAAAMFARATVTIRTARHSTTSSLRRRFWCVPVRGCRNHCSLYWPRPRTCSSGSCSEPRSGTSRAVSTGTPADTSRSDSTAFRRP